MPNFTFQIQNCKIFKTGKKVGKGWGTLYWTDGTIEFEQKFETHSQLIIDAIEAHRDSEATFKVSGNMTKSEGYGAHAGKSFNNWIISELEVVNVENSKPAWKEAIENLNSSDEDENDFPF